MERMKPQHSPLPAVSPTPLPLPSPHLIFILGAASTALGREQRNLTPAPLPRLELGPCAGRGLLGPRGPIPGPSRPQGSGPGDVGGGGRSGVGRPGMEAPKE